MLRIIPDPVPQTFVAGPGVEFVYVERNAGVVEDAADDALAAGLGTDERAFVDAVWGRVVLGWSGLEDAAGAPVPFDPPAGLLADVREALGEKIGADVVTRRARGLWTHAVVRALPAKTKRALEAAIGSGDRRAAEALGN